jgi:hypothetical protein
MYQDQDVVEEGMEASAPLPRCDINARRERTSREVAGTDAFLTEEGNETIGKG